MKLECAVVCILANAQLPNRLQVSQPNVACNGKANTPANFSMPPTNGTPSKIGGDFLERILEMSRRDSSRDSSNTRAHALPAAHTDMAVEGRPPMSADDLEANEGNIFCHRAVTKTTEVLQSDICR